MSKINFSEIKAGDQIKADAGFDCLRDGQICTVYAEDGLQKNLCVICDKGTHFLEGQKSTDGSLVGFNKP